MRKRQSRVVGDVLRHFERFGFTLLIVGIPAPVRTKQADLTVETGNEALNGTIIHRQAQRQIGVHRTHGEAGDIVRLQRRPDRSRNERIVRPDNDVRLVELVARDVVGLGRIARGLQEGRCVIGQIEAQTRKDAIAFFLGLQRLGAIELVILPTTTHHPGACGLRRGCTGRWLKRTVVELIRRTAHAEGRTTQYGVRDQAAGRGLHQRCIRRDEVLGLPIGRRIGWVRYRVPTVLVPVARHTHYTIVIDGLDIGDEVTTITRERRTEGQ